MIESGIIFVLAAMGSCDTLRDKIAKEDGIGCVLQSFLRVQMNRGKLLVDSSGSPGCSAYNDYLIKEIMDSCLEFLLW